MRRATNRHRLRKVAIPAVIGVGVGAAGLAGARTLARRFTQMRRAVPHLPDIPAGDLTDDLRAKLESLLASNRPGPSARRLKTGRFDASTFEERRHERAARRKRRHQRTTT